MPSLCACCTKWQMLARAVDMLAWLEDIVDVYDGCHLYPHTFLQLHQSTSFIQYLLEHQRLILLFTDQKQGKGYVVGHPIFIITYYLSFARLSHNVDCLLRIFQVYVSVLLNSVQCLFYCHVVRSISIEFRPLCLFCSYIIGAHVFLIDSLFSSLFIRANLLLYDYACLFFQKKI